MIAAVVLAAGNSARLGQPKQLLRQAGQPLVRRMAIAALEAGCAPVVVVVGKAHQHVAAALEGLPLIVVANEHWETGIAGSIRAGIQACPDSDATLLLSCDQPSVDRGLIRWIIEVREQTGQPIIASAYAGTLGIPALFGRQFYADLIVLTGDQGAKSIIIGHPDQVASVSFPNGAIDVDLPDDLRHLEPDDSRAKTETQSY